MSEKKRTCSRRDFLKTTGAAGMGTLLASIAPFADASAFSDENLLTQTESKMVVPTRPFGKTGINVSILGLGGMFDIPNNQLLLKQALQWGVTYWDTADCYEGGNSEKGIGKYFKKYPEARHNVFLVTKSDAQSLDGMAELLNRSLERMNTTYVDLYFVHGIRSIRELTTDTRKWVEKAKAQKKMKFFGFSTHRNMEECMTEAAKLGWIDGIMMSYNYRLMQTDKMKSAVDACEKAGIGLSAMKTQGGGSISTSNETELKLAGRFLQKGFTDKQAKLKAVWENEQISSICSQMPTLTILMSNVAAALDKTRLSSTDMRLLRQYAYETAYSYCAGCSDICESVIDGDVPVSDLMRCLMYSRSYGDKERAHALYHEIPAQIRNDMLHLDYTVAEERCPQKMAISTLIKEASEEFA